MNLISKFKILTYNIGFITKGLDSVMHDGISRGDICWMRHPYKDRFFADPFLFDSDNEFFYILCEEYFFWDEKGIITLLTVKKENFELAKREVVIEEETHLSFPYCNYKGNTISPESSASGNYVEYTINRDKKIIAKKIILDEGTIDAIQVENNEGVWMLTGKSMIPSTDLYLYKKDGERFIQCGETPVLSDNRYARSAGNMFRWKERTFRPVQDCKGRYGRQTKIMEVIEIGNNGYYAEEYCTLNSFANPPFNETMHTFNVYDDIILTDGSRDFFRFPMKIFYRKCPWMFRR